MTRLTCTTKQSILKQVATPKQHEIFRSIKFEWQRTKEVHQTHNTLSSSVLIWWDIFLNVSCVAQLLDCQAGSNSGALNTGESYRLVHLPSDNHKAMENPLFIYIYIYLYCSHTVRYMLTYPFLTIRVLKPIYNSNFIVLKPPL